MKKSEMIESLANDTGLSKADSTKAFNKVFEIIKGELVKGNNVAVSGFGTFKISNRAARTARNPQTGKPIQVPASKSVSFKASADLKRTVNE